jgi:hypothetical protein
VTIINMAINGTITIWIIISCSITSQYFLKVAEVTSLDNIRKRREPNRDLEASDTIIQDTTPS